CGIDIRFVLQNVLSGDISRDSGNRLDDAARDLGGISTGAYGQRVIAGVGGVRQVTGNILVEIFVERVFHLTAGLVGQTLEHVLMFVGEAESHGAHPVDGDQVAVGQLEDLFESLFAGIIFAIP